MKNIMDGDVKMIICETEFEAEDPKKKGYSANEIDFYVTIPPRLRKRVKDHRLSLRKNLTTDQYELYRCYHPLRQGDQPRTEVTFSTSSLEEVLRKANDEVNRIWIGSHREPDQVCDHDTNRSRKCRIWKERRQG